jgi:hypothetical protein
VITVQTTEADVRVTIPKGDVPLGRLNAFLECLRLESILCRSSLTEEEAGRLAEEIKAGWWAANRDRFIRPAGKRTLPTSPSHSISMAGCGRKMKS